eukprot:Hpha_TRINITY_DN15055_c4_g2::TRINITY_DN15055_c4_g2_i3::g.126242::m.126242/K14558/PWP2, UTP1; periodic tryptophan protein 2
MRTDFTFSNLCGAVYKQGNIAFANDGKELISPVGNRVAVYDLAQSASQTSAFTTLKDIIAVDLSEDETLLVVADSSGMITFVNWQARLIIDTATTTFTDTNRIVKVSPGRRFVAVSTGAAIDIYTTPPTRTRQFKSVNVIRRISVCSADVTAIKWSPCGQFLFVGSEDCCVRVVALTRKQRSETQRYSGKALPKSMYQTLSGVHRTPIVDIFLADPETLISVSTDRAVARWVLSDKATGWWKPKKGGNAGGGRGDMAVDSEDEPEEPEEEEEEEEEESDEEEPVRYSERDVRRLLRDLLGEVDPELLEMIQSELRSGRKNPSELRTELESLLSGSTGGGGRRSQRNQGRRRN